MERNSTELLLDLGLLENKDGKRESFRVRDKSKAGKQRTGQGNRESLLILVRLLEVVIMAEIYQSVYPSLVIWQEKVQYRTE